MVFQLFMWRGHGCIDCLLSKHMLFSWYQYTGKESKQLNIIVRGVCDAAQCVQMYERRRAGCYECEIWLCGWQDADVKIK